jgi:nucleoside phosphorylase
LQVSETDIAIIAPTGVEWLGILDQLKNATPVDDFPLPTKAGTIGRHSVLCCSSGKGQEETASAATLVLERAKPSWVFLVGIAGGFPQQGVSRGDVIIAHVIHSFDYGKLVGGTFKRRPENDINCDRKLLAWAEIAAHERNQDWRQSVREPRPDEGDPSGFKIHLDSYVASSNKVVDDPDHEFYATVASAFPEIHAVEMEGIGAGASARLAQSERAVGFLMIRGISDEPELPLLQRNSVLSGRNTRSRRPQLSLAPLLNASPLKKNSMRRRSFCRKPMSPRSPGDWQSLPV